MTTRQDSLEAKTVALQFDSSSEFHDRVRKHVETEEVGWLTTISSDGIPQPNPVWFIWDDGTFVILSKPDQAKLANIRRQPGSSLNLETTKNGGVVIFTGTADSIERSDVSASTLDNLASKYSSGLAELGWTREHFEQEYSATIRFTPAKVRGW